MPEGKQSISAKMYEETLKRIKDIMTARVVLDSNGEIEEIHILAGPGRAVKHIVRDVESSIIAAFGIPVDRRKISIAQIGLMDSVQTEKRVQLERVEIVSGVDVAEIDVRAKLGSTEVSGKATGAPTGKNWLWLAAEATISAVAQLLPSTVSFHLDDVYISSSRAAKIAIVSLTLSAFGQQHFLTGSCPVKQDEREAAVKATLDALNRKLAQLLTSS